MNVVTVVIPTYNEELNINNSYMRIKKVFDEKLSEYDFQVLYIDNASTDKTRQLIRKLTEQDKRVQAIFNNTNFGFSKSSFYGLSQAEGDCAVLMYADMQDPPELIPEMIKKWEEGYKVVVGIKNKSKERRLMYLMRNVYYNIVDKISDAEHIKQFDGFGLYDASFVEELRNLDDPLPYLRGIVAEMGPSRASIYYTQEKREKGKSSFSFMKYFDVAMLGMTSSSRAVMRMATFLGLILSFICVLVALITFIIKLMYWDYFNVGTAAILIGIFFVGGIQIFFLGFLGEYIANINQRTMHHPIVVESERINMRRKIKP